MPRLLLALFLPLARVFDFCFALTVHDSSRCWCEACRRERKRFWERGLR